MGRTVIANRNIEKLLKELNTNNKFTYGFIIGQPSVQGRDYVIHLARTFEPPQYNESGDKDAVSIAHVDSVSKIDSQVLINHAVSLTRMIPGCFYILGIFVASEENIFEKDQACERIKQLLNETFKVLSEDKSQCLNYEAEKLVLSYTSLDERVVCKSFDVKLSKGTFTPVEWKFVEKTQWYLFETNYEVDDVFPLIQNERDINIEENFTTSLEDISRNIENSEIFLQNKKVDNEQTLENYIKDRYNKKEDTKHFKATIYVPAIASNSEPATIKRFNGTMRYSGIVHSRIWAQPKNTLKEIEAFIRNDIIRSLTARIRLYCDALNDSNTREDSLVVSEPPRRVFFELPNCPGVEFSEYIFRSETTEIVSEQAKEILDLQIDCKNVRMDLENLPDLDDDVKINNTATLNQTTLPSSESNRTIYITGITIALLIVLLSIILHLVLH